MSGAEFLIHGSRQSSGARAVSLRGASALGALAFIALDDELLRGGLDSRLDGRRC